jgi:hypothetical protein
MYVFFHLLHLQFSRSALNDAGYYITPGMKPQAPFHASNRRFVTDHKLHRKMFCSDIKIMSSMIRLIA